LAQFAFAREFVDREGKRAPLEPSRIEKMGHSLANILLKPLDVVLTQIRNPAVIAALTVASLLMTAIIFYPGETMLILTRVLPFLKHLQAGHVKFSFYVLSQVMIFGLGLRTMGRLSNTDLMDAFRKKEIFPIPLGAIRIQ
jgi:hypothetical protein